MNKEEIWCRKFKINSLNQAILFHWIAVAVILKFWRLRKKNKSHTGEEAERDVSFQNMSKKERDSSEVEARAVQICKP